MCDRRAPATRHVAGSGWDNIFGKDDAPEPAEASAPAPAPAATNTSDAAAPSVGGTSYGALAGELRSKK